MDKEYLKTVSSYKHRVLNYIDWKKYIAQQYEKSQKKKHDPKKQRAQNTDTPINFNW